MVYEIVKRGEKFVFREPKISDAKDLMEHVNSLVEEGALILRNEKVTLVEERKWLKDLISDIKSGNKVVYVVVHKKSKKVVGMCSISKGRFSRSHVGELAIGINKEFRGMGLGKELIKYTIKEAKKKLKIETVTLSVFENNKVAIKVYKKLGFKIYGKLKRGLKRNNTYYDEILMYKRVA